MRVSSFLCRHIEGSCVHPHTYIYIHTYYICIYTDIHSYIYILCLHVSMLVCQVATEVFGVAADLNPEPKPGILNPKPKP